MKHTNDFNFLKISSIRIPPQKVICSTGLSMIVILVCAI